MPTSKQEVPVCVCVCVRPLRACAYVGAILYSWGHARKSSECVSTAAGTKVITEGEWRRQWLDHARRFLPAVAVTQGGGGVLGGRRPSCQLNNVVVIFSKFQIRLATFLPLEKLPVTNVGAFLVVFWRFCFAAHESSCPAPNSPSHPRPPSLQANEGKRQANGEVCNIWRF